MVARTSQSGGDDKSSKRGNSRCFSPDEPRHTSCPGVEKRGEPRLLGWGGEGGGEGRRKRTNYRRCRAPEMLDRTQQVVEDDGSLTCIYDKIRLEFGESRIKFELAIRKLGI